MLRKITNTLAIAVIILGGVVVGGLGLLIGLICGLTLRSYKQARVLALSLSTLLFALSYYFQGFDNGFIKVSMHDAISILENRSLAVNAIACLFFTIVGTDLARWIQSVYAKKQRKP